MPTLSAGFSCCDCDALAPCHDNGMFKFLAGEGTSQKDTFPSCEKHADWIQDEKGIATEVKRS